MKHDSLILKSRSPWGLHPNGKISNYEFLNILFLNISCPKLQNTIIIKTFIEYMIIPIALISSLPITLS
jgi:hypothetical protein